MGEPLKPSDNLCEVPVCGLKYRLKGLIPRAWRARIMAKFDMMAIFYEAKIVWCRSSHGIIRPQPMNAAASIGPVP